MDNTDKLCEFCGEPLPTRTLEFGSFSREVYDVCTCEQAQAAKAAAAAEALKQERETRILELQRIYDIAGIPPEHRRFDHPLSRQHYETVKNGTGLYIVGLVGRGKTTLACAIARRLISRGVSRVRFLAAVDLPSMITATYKRGADETEDELIHKYSACNVLVLDDLGKGRSTDFAVNAFYQIIDRRTRNLLPTIVTSQYERDKLAEWMARSVDPETAESLASRLAGHCERIHITGPDLRITKNIEGN